ncbi:MAG: GxxExxY protein [Bacteroidaceae bacterium]|nr:GxxExxY protein [Bacteroidaceae bacterium]
MKNYKIERLVDKDPILCNKLKQFCYDINGCCQEVHRDMGPFLNEYMYQDALEIVLEEHLIKPFTREYYFSVEFHGKRINHKHFVDFFVKDKVFIECKAVEKLCLDHRQQLWNYMRLTKTRIGILWNFAPVRDQSEHYYLDTETDTMYMF